jgi:hypothetical protein
MSYIGTDELIFNRDIDNNIYSGGFSVESIMLKNGFSPITSVGGSSKGNVSDTNQVSDLFHNLVVPNWLLTNYKHSFVGGSKIFDKEIGEKDADYNDNVIDDDLHDKLLDLVNADAHNKNNKRKSRNKHNKITKHRNTKKYQK